MFYNKNEISFSSEEENRRNEDVRMFNNSQSKFNIKKKREHLCKRIKKTQKLIPR